MKSYMVLPTNPELRKEFPMTTGVLDYFPRALAAVALTSKVGNDQHNPGQPLHWAKEKSRDHADCIPRHLVDRDSYDSDGIPHRFKLAWRALADLETYLEENPNLLEHIAQNLVDARHMRSVAKDAMNPWPQAKDEQPCAFQSLSGKSNTEVLAAFRSDKPWVR